jgi:hypothetical protein
MVQKGSIMTRPTPEEVDALIARLKADASGPQSSKATVAREYEAAAMLRCLSAPTVPHANRIKQLEHGYDVLRTTLHKTKLALAEAQAEIISLKQLILQYQDFLNKL